MSDMPPASPDGSALEASGQEPSAAPKKNYVIAWLLALFLGMFGADRFYLGKKRSGIWKLCTFGGLMMWWLGDIIRCLKRYVIREVYHLIKVNPRTGEIAS